MHCREWFAWTSLFCLLSGLSGCGSTGVQIGEVSGTVTAEGAPLEGALVQFIPVDGGRSSQGRTNEQGRYRLDYSVHQSGSLVGPMKVMITTGNLEDPQHRNETIAFEYNYESTLQVDVKRGQNTFDFDVKKRVMPVRGR